MKRVLIVSPHFPPVNAPDHQRVRMILPYLEPNEWLPTVLAVHPAEIAAPNDETLLELLPAKYTPEYAHALPLGLARVPGLGTLSWRAYLALKKKGDSLLENGAYDLIFFSSTQFGIFTLGRYWKQKWGIPFALDLQDPWINHFYREHGITPPGGQIKFNIQQKLSYRQAKKTIPQAAGLCAVSKDYIHYFQQKKWTSNKCIYLTQPFPYASQDWKTAQHHQDAPPWSEMEHARHWIYAGRGGADLQPCLSALFQSLARYMGLSQPSAPPIHLWFIGTHYGNTSPNEQPIRHLAAQHGFPYAHEIPARLPFLTSLHWMLKSDGLIIPGSVDPRYNPSKLIPLLAAEKPLLALAPETSPCAVTMNEIAPENVLTYPLPLDPVSFAEKLFDYWNQHSLILPATDEVLPKLKSREAEPSARRLSQFFNDCITHA